MLTRSGCRSDEAANSRDALALLHSAALVHDPFRVAFLDSDMPATESQELAKHIASDPEFKEVAVVFMVPLGRERNLNSLHLQGFAGSLSKPVWQASLYRALGHALREKKRNGGIAGGSSSAPKHVLQRAHRPRPDRRRQCH